MTYKKRNKYASKSKGWREKKSLVITDKGLENKALRHSEAARKAKLKKLNTGRIIIKPKNQVPESQKNPFILDSGNIKPTHISPQKIKETIQGEGIINKISEKAEKLTPFKIALQLAFPQAALPIEGVYQVLTNLDTIRNMYNYSGTPNNDLKKAFSEIVEGATKNIANSTIQQIKDITISNIVDNSAKYLDEKQVFEDLTEKLNLDKSNINNFKDFYKTSLKNYIDREFEKNVDFFR